MAYMESTSRSGLAGLAALQDREQDQTPYGAPDDGQEPELEPEAPREVAEAPHGSDKELLLNWADDGNIARYIDNETLSSIGQQVVLEYEIDLRSREEWADTAETAMRFCLQKTEPKTSPWPGAANFIFPLITKGALEFNARAYGAIIQGRNVVKGVVWGDDTGQPMTQNGQPMGAQPGQSGQPGAPAAPAPGGQDPGQPQGPWLVAPGEKTARANRVGEHMSWQLLVDNPEWEPQTDALLLQSPVIGGAVRKTFHDRSTGKNRSLFVSLMNCVWNYQAPSFEAAPRHSEKVWLYPHEITELERAEQNDNGEGLFLPISYGGSDAGEPDPEAPNRHSDPADASAQHMFIAQHRRWDLDNDGYPEPYIITVHKQSAKVVRIEARYDAETIKADKKGRILSVDPVDQFSLLPFFPNIEGGSYPMGFGHLLRALSEGINTTLNQMFDAGTLQNTGAGFIGDQMGIASGSMNFEVGKFKRVNTKGMSIRESIYQIPFPGPSPVLFQLLGLLISAGEGIAGVQQILTGDAAIANAPPTTVLALIEQGIQGYTAIVKRMLRGFSAEYDKLFKLNRKHLKADKTFPVGDEQKTITPHDLRQSGGVVPIADPTMTTNMQRLGRGQLLMSVAGDPMMNKREIMRRYLEAGNIERIDDLFASPDPMQTVVAQLGMAKAQAEISRLKAAETKDMANAFYFMAQARALADESQSGFIDQQLNLLRLSIESTNAQTKAASVAFQAHHQAASRAAESAHKNADRAADLIKHFNPQQSGGAGGDDDSEADAGAGAGGAAGPFPVPVGPADGGGMGGLAGQPGDGGLPALSGG